MNKNIDLKEKEERTLLSSFLDLMFLLEIIAFPIFLILMIWTDNSYVLSRLILSDFILFALTMALYGLLCYKPKDKQ